MLPKYSYRHKLSHFGALRTFYFKLFFSSSGDEERAKDKFVLKNLKILIYQILQDRVDRVNSRILQLNS